MATHTPALRLEHSNEVSGITIFPNNYHVKKLQGVKAYWTEGRSSMVIFVYPDGETDAIEVYASDDRLVHLDEANEDPQVVSRPMNAVEEADWEAVFEGHAGQEESMV